MNKKRKIGFRIFVSTFAFAVIFSYVVNSSLFEKTEKPWHMQPFANEDVLAANYTDQYEVLEKIGNRFNDSSRVTVRILVDAWGVPFERALLEEDFAIFGKIPHKELLHVRMANRTRHAEFAELRNLAGTGIYLFGGDSLEYGRNLYIDSLGYSEKIFCQKCDDTIMLAKLDSAIDSSEETFFALTTQNARNGAREQLHNTLVSIATLAQKHPQVRFIVQGTHRPILGTPEVRKQHYAKWVPLVILN